jgi:hypothetical protein
MNDISSAYRVVPATHEYALGAGGWIFVIAIYLYMAYALYTIAKKTNTMYPWMAWIPILNYWLMVKIARKGVGWFILMLIPFLNLIAMIVVWMKIAEERRRPSWWGILVIIPVANFVMMGILAFSEATNQVAPPPSPTPPAIA